MGGKRDCDMGPNGPFINGRINVESTQRLYRVGCDRYVQHDGALPLPAEVEAFRLRSRGEDPPHLLLPRGPVVFHVGIEISYERKVPWDGKGPLPDPVLAYVREHGTLPRHRTDAELADDPQIHTSDVLTSCRKAS
jgi:hypothetical protein